MRPCDELSYGSHFSRYVARAFLDLVGTAPALAPQPGSGPFIARVSGKHI